MTFAGEAPPSNEILLNDPPKDGISSVNFGPSSNQFLAVSSWDGYVRIYDIKSNKCRHKYEHNNEPVLDCTFQDSVHVWSGGADKTVRLFDCNRVDTLKCGTHEDTVRCVEFAGDTNQIVTGSWDGTVKLWDPRNPMVATGTYNQTDKVYTLAVCGEKIIVGTANRKVLIWDLRNMAFVQQKRDSSLRYQTRCIRAFPNKQGYVVSSIEGRVAVEYIDPSPEVQKKKYAFKCHRAKDPETRIENIYPVNAIAFHQIHNTFATGGSDCIVNIWDGFNKKRLCQFHKFPSSISSLSFSPDGSILAIASSFMHEHKLDEDQPHPPDQVFIRYVTDQEVKPK